MKNSLQGVVVVDLSTEISGPFTSKMLADQGAEVIKVEPKEGDPARRFPPFLDEKDQIESSAYFMYLNTNKKSVVLDLESSSDRSTLETLLSKADICVENFTPAESKRLGITYDLLSKINPGLVLTSITGFGGEGPYKDYKGADIVYQALGGYHYLSGQFTREPVQSAYNQSQLTAGRYALVPTLAALRHKRRTGEGQHVEISTIECMASLPPSHIPVYTYAGTVTGRGPGRKVVMDGDFLECKDGYICLTTGGGNTMEQWAIFFEMFELLEPEFETAALRLQNSDRLDELFKPILDNWEKKVFMKEAMDQRFVVGMVQTPQDIINCPQLEAREFFHEISHPVAGTYRYPGPGFRWDNDNPLRGSQPAPLLGQHTDEILHNLDVS